MAAHPQPPGPVGDGAAGTAIASPSTMPDAHGDAWSLARLLAAAPAADGRPVPCAPLAALLAQLPVGVVIAEPGGRIAYANAAAERIVGHPLATPRDVASYTAWVAFHDDGRPLQGLEHPLARALLRGECDETGEHLHQRADGTQLWVRLTSAPLRDAAGTVVACVAVLADVDRARRAEDGERVARREAEEAGRAKSEFLAMMSHELRAPLNAIAGYVERMRTGVPVPLPAEHAEHLARIERSQQQLLGLINAVLNYARIEAGDVDYRIMRVPVDALLAEVEPLVHPQLRQRALEWSLEPAEPGVPVLADFDKAVQVLFNLVSNAAKFTPAGGSVSVAVSALDIGPGGRPAIAIAVTDTGVGIPREQLERIFEPFVQVDALLARESHGTGLGLAISRDLARGMGGDVTARSIPGEGSTFTLLLRRAE